MSSVTMSSRLRLSQRAAWAEGQPISELMSKALANEDLISLAAGFVDQQTLPAGETRQALDELLAESDAARAALQYGTTPGYTPLRELLLQRYLASDGPLAATRPSLDQIVLTTGSNQLLHLVAECLLDPGDIVICAAPTYLVFLGTLANIGARAVGVATDEQGMIPAALEEAFRRLEAAGELTRVKALYLVPYFDNPQGINMPLARTAEIVELVRRHATGHKIHLIADEAYRQLRYSGDDVPSALAVDEDGDTVVVAGTFSKSFSPGIRVGWGILPRHLVAPVCDLKGNIDFGSPNFNQHLMARVVESGLFDRHVATIRAGYLPKLQAMLAAASEFLSPIPGVTWTHPRGGLYVWAQLPEGVDTGPQGKLFDRAVAEGVLYVPGQYCHPGEGEPVHKNTMRLSFGVQSCQRIGQGMQALARAIGELGSEEPGVGE